MIEDRIGSKPAPQPLRTVQAFVNTSDVETGREDLATPRDLRQWLSERELLKGDETFRDADLRQAKELRAALRQMLLANNSGASDPGAIGVMNRFARTAQMVLTFKETGEAEVRPAAEGPDGALGRILARVCASMADGTWQRLKACKQRECLWAFYDRSKNHSGAWCAMSVCGNRTKARGYRNRSRGS